MKAICVSHRLTHTMILFYPMYPFTMYSLRGTWSVGVTGWFCLWVVFYVFDEWSLGKLRGSLDFSTCNNHEEILDEEDFTIF